MSENLKIRFRLPNGEEFEAEGTQDFIESQRTFFLNLVGHALRNTQQVGGKQTAPALAVVSSMQEVIAAAEPKTAIIAPVTTISPLSSPNTPKAPAENLRHLWEKLLKEENGYLILRRKTRLSAHEAALLILAGAKNLLAQADYRAILLAKSIKLSGFEPARLDRLLANEIKAAYIVAQGSKRSRSYALTPAGYAKAFVLAEKRAGEIL